MKQFLTYLLFVLGINCSAQISPKLRTGYNNPVIDHHFTADPTAVEYGGRLYVYGTNDSEQYENGEKNSYEKIKSLTMMSTDDMVNWTFHGFIPVGTIAPWIVNSWAPSVVSRTEADGSTHFYLYFSNSGVGTGVLTATSPLGPWTSPLGHSLVDGNTPGLNGCNAPFDPGATIDDKGTGWIAFGGACGRIARLGKDMISFDSEFVNPRPQHHFEANEMNYIGGKYVYTYNIDWQDHSDWTLSDEIPSTCCMAYMTSTTPLDSMSWKYGNNYLKNAGDFPGFTYTNNHTHLQKYNGQWYLFYHTEMLQDDMNMVDNGYRSIQVATIDVDETTAHISPATIDKQGVSQLHPLNPYILQQAETAAATEGIKFIPTDAIGNMIVTPGNTFIKETPAAQSIILVRGADFGKHSKNVSLRLSGHGSVEVHADSIGSPALTELTVASQEWKQARSKCRIAGIHDIIFILKGNVSFDSWKFN